MNHSLDREFPELPGSGPIRFGCGAVAGAVFGFVSAMRYAKSEGRFVALVLGGAIVFGLLSTVLKDAFWRDIISMRGMFRWWWWR
jgi:hypothetical protein